VTANHHLVLSLRMSVEVSSSVRCNLDQSNISCAKSCFCLFRKSSRSVGFTILRALARLGLVYVSEERWLYNSQWYMNGSSRLEREMGYSEHMTTFIHVRSSREEISSHRSV